MSDTNRERIINELETYGIVIEGIEALTDQELEVVLQLAKDFHYIFKAVV